MSLSAKHHGSKPDEEYVAELNALEKKYRQNKHMLEDLFSHRVKLMRAQHDEALARLQSKLANDAETREVSAMVRIRVRLQNLRHAIDLYAGQADACVNELKRYTQRCQEMKADLKRQVHRVLKQVPGDKQHVRKRRKMIIQSWARVTR